MVLRSLFMIGALLLFPAAANAGCSEEKPAPTVLTINLELPEPYYDLKQSVREINRNHTADDWIKAQGMEKVWKSSDMVLLGYAEGGMAVISMSRFEAVHYDPYGVYYCPFVKSLDIAMIFRTRIAIPNDFKKGGCKFNLIHEHEHRHYMTNRSVAEAFAKRLHKDLPVIIAEIERSRGLVERGNAENVMQEMGTSIEDAVKSYILESMTIELKRQNGQIDTPQEYSSTGKKIDLCED